MLCCASPGTTSMETWLLPSLSSGPHNMESAKPSGDESPTIKVGSLRGLGEGLCESIKVKCFQMRGLAHSSLSIKGPPSPSLSYSSTPSQECCGWEWTPHFIEEEKWDLEDSQLENIGAGEEFSSSLPLTDIQGLEMKLFTA